LVKRRVLVADSHPLAVCGLESVLAQTDDLQVVRAISDLSKVDAVVGETPADVLVLDLDAAPHSPNMLVRLKHVQPKLKIVGVGAPGDPASVRSAFALGADGYHVRTVTADELIAGLRRILIATEFTPIGEATELEASPSPLTKRELVILEAVSRGLSNKRIARDLRVTEQTVKFHLSNTFRKLGVSNRTAATRAGQRLGLLTLSLVGAAQL
jgi:DNA-binding NarL/FixJ family response regulator